MGAVQGMLEGSDYLALDRHSFTGDPRTGSCAMPAAAEACGHFVNVYFRTLRAEANASEFRLNFLKDTGNHNRGDGADMIDQALGVAAFSAGPSEISFFEPEIGDLVVVSESKMIVDVA